MQAKGATLFEVVYLDSGESVPVLVGIGDALVAAEWAKEQVPLPAKPELAGREPVEAEFLIEEYRAEKAEIEAERQHIAGPVSYTHLRAHETVLELVCRLMLEKKKSPLLLMEYILLIPRNLV